MKMPDENYRKAPKQPTKIESFQSFIARMTQQAAIKAAQMLLQADP
jgi:hypothetical protein